MRVWNSVRVRLAVASAASVGLAVVVIGMVAYARLHNKLDDADEEFARHEAKEVAQVLGQLPSATAVREQLAHAEPRIFPEEGVVHLQVFDLAGGLVASLPANTPAVAWPEGLVVARAGGEPTGPLRAPDGRDGIRAARLVTVDGAPRWLVVSHVDTRKSGRVLAEMRRLLLLGPVLAAAIVFAGAYLLLALALRPLEVLVDDARMLAAEGLGRRLAQPPPGSELGELVRLLNVMLARTEQTVSRVRRFAADASHELRTPLARMRGEAEVALRSGREADSQEALVSILDEIDSLRRLVDGLLDLAHGDTERLHSTGSFDIAVLVAELGEEARVVGAARGLRIELSTVAGPLVVAASRDLCGRALWNLIDNAIKYVPIGGRIRIAVACSQGDVAISVDDDGPGIPAPLLAHLFQPFARGDPARSPPASGEVGYGLGLALARTIARRSGGDIVCARSSPGARFVLRLPLDRSLGSSAATLSTSGRTPPALQPPFCSG